MESLPPSFFSEKFNAGPQSHVSGLLDLRLAHFFSEKVNQKYGLPNGGQFDGDLVWWQLDFKHGIFSSSKIGDYHFNIRILIVFDFQGYMAIWYNPLKKTPQKTNPSALVMESGG